MTEAGAEGGTPRDNTIALYLCTWKNEADGTGDDKSTDKDSVDGIDSQRAFLRHFAEMTPDLNNGTILEYADENYEGSELQRPAFCQLLEDAKKGVFRVLLLQNPACLSKDDNTACGYLQKIFPLLGIRVIAVNAAYDSDRARQRIEKTGTAFSQKTVPNRKAAEANTREGSVFDPADAAADYYRREQSRKIRAGLQAKWKEGKSTASHPPYGYVKDETAKGGWAVDPEAARVVQQIFEQAGEGMQVKEIVAYLNGKGIAPPSVYREQKEAVARKAVACEVSDQEVSGREGFAQKATDSEVSSRDASARSGNRKVSSAESLWDNEKVRAILTRYSYTGANVWKPRSSKGSGSPLFPADAENGQTIMENVHEAIVTKEQYEKAQAMRQRRRSSRIRGSAPYALRGKVRCGVCRLAMSRTHRKDGDAFFCSHRKYTGEHSECSGEYIPAKHIEQAAMQQFCKWQQEQERAAEEPSAELMEMGTEKTGTESRKMATKAVAVKRQEIADEAADMKGEKTKSEKTAKETEYDRMFSEMVEPYIDTVYVYTADRIEVVFRQK